MKHKKIRSMYFVRIDNGEKIMESLRNFLEKENIRCGFFTGIGAISHCTTKFYSQEKKEYIESNFHGEYEITSLTGNISTLDGKPFIHAHIAFFDSDMKSFGGHLDEAVVGATCEIFLKDAESEIKRKMDKGLRLNLMDL